jgi:hypothetical protein
MRYYDILSISIGSVYLLPFIGYLITYNTYHAVSCIGILGTMGVSEFIKYYVIKTHSPRPAGARNCNILCTNGRCEGEPGMPSSHAALVSFFTGRYALYFDHHRLILPAMLVYTTLILYARWIKRCHTVKQLGVGVALGWMLSYLVDV